MYVCSRRPLGLNAREYASLLNYNPAAKSWNWNQCSETRPRTSWPRLASGPHDGRAGWLASRVMNTEYQAPGARACRFSRLTR